MPLPLILGAAAAVAGLVGVGNGIHGMAKVAEANDTMKSVKRRHEKNLDKFKKQNELTSGDMDAVGNLEFAIMASFEEFSDVFEKIKSRPQFKEYDRNGVNIPKYDKETLKEVSIGAGALLGALGGAAAGTAGGFAASGAATAAVTALGTASTGTAIASLSGAALNNAILAALGGGSLAAGGGGIALGTTILGAASLGAGLLVGGIIFNLTGSNLSDKADEAYKEMQRAEKEINRTCEYMIDLSQVANQYRESLESVDKIYREHLKQLKNIVNISGKTNWNDFTEDEKLCTENTTLLVGLLYKMCKVQLVLKAEDEKELNTINYQEADKSMVDAKKVLLDIQFNRSVPSDNSHDFAASENTAITKKIASQSGKARQMRTEIERLEAREKAEETVSEMNRTDMRHAAEIYMRAMDDDSVVDDYLKSGFQRRLAKENDLDKVYAAFQTMYATYKRVGKRSALETSQVLGRWLHEKSYAGVQHSGAYYIPES